MTASQGDNTQLDVDINTIRDTLLEACEEAAKITLPLFRNATQVTNKAGDGFDPVTIADRNAEVAIREVIARRFPDHDIIGEEQENKTGDTDYSWIIDPIDGTRAFISGLPVWGTLIGVAYRQRVFAGVMSQPFIGETFIASPGQSTYARHGQTVPLGVSTTTELAQAKLFTTTPSLFEGRQRDAFNRLEQAVMLPRYGCDCYAYCLLAGGHVDLVAEPRLNTYDIAALIPIIREAGGVVTAFDGRAPDQGGDILAAATPQLHAAALAILHAD